MLRKFWIVLGAVALFTTASVAGLFPGQKFPAGRFPTSVAVGDLDADGRPDLVTANAGSDDVTVLLGRGDGTFAAAVSYAAGHCPNSVAVGDFDQDGRADLVTANACSDDVTVLLGHGDGTFAAGVSFAAGYEPWSVAVGDFNRDGWLDIVSANTGYTVPPFAVSDLTVLLGHGDGTFASAVSVASVGLGSVAVGDFDQDGHLDLVTGPTVTVLMGHGDGTFAAGVRYYGPAGPVTVADLNQDGRQDLITWEGSVLLGHGDGTFADAVSSPGRLGGVIAVGDFDQDGRADLVVKAIDSDDVWVLLGHGDGTFDYSGATYAAGYSPWSAAVGDFDLDGRADLVTANHGSDDVTVLRGNGDGTFAAAISYRWRGGLLTVADFNQDGWPDLVTGDGLGRHSVSVRLGHGDGTFAARVSYAVGYDPLAIAVGDFNQDGREDLVVANYDDHVTVLAGHGDGGFAAGESYAVGDTPRSVAVGDFNRDGRADLVTANDGSDDVTVVLGHGDGTFAAPVSYAAGDFPSSIAVGDFNQDGSLDLVTGTRLGERTGSVLLGNGNGTFAAAVSYVAGDYWPWFVSVGDFNHDGHPDLVTANRGGFPFYEPSDVTVLMGHGDGTFAAPVSYAAGHGPVSVAVGDFNQDGRADLVTANDGSHDVTVLLGHGDGTFAAGVSYAGGVRVGSVTVGDFNQDGRHDLVVAGGSPSRVVVLINQHGRALTISVDIKPDDYPNSINPHSRGVVPVTILGNDMFDVASIDVTTLAFGPGAASPAHNLTDSFTYNDHLQDVNLDGFADLVTHFRTRDTGIACGDESVTLTGETVDGQRFEGTDSLQTVGCRVTRRPAIWMKDQNRFDKPRSDGPVDIKRD